MKNLMLLELDELYAALVKLQTDDRFGNKSEEKEAINILKKYIESISMKAESI